MTTNNQPAGVTPMSAMTVHTFTAAYRELCPTIDDKVPVGVFAERLN